jgi:uncharacterized protein YuzB (UPF0349 family)
MLILCRDFCWSIRQVIPCTSGLRIGVLETKTSYGLKQWTPCKPVHAVCFFCRKSILIVTIRILFEAHLLTKNGEMGVEVVNHECFCQPCENMDISWFGLVNGQTLSCAVSAELFLNVLLILFQETKFHEVRGRNITTCPHYHHRYVCPLQQPRSVLASV